MYRKLLPVLAAAGLLVFGIGASGAVADDNENPATPQTCTISGTPQSNSEDAAATAIGQAADDVNQEADNNQQGDDQQGDQQDENDQSGEQGDCENDNNDDGGGDD